MDRLKALVHEIHRRSLWQVMGIFMAASWGVLQVVEVVTESVGLPDWTPGMAFVLLLIGLPVVLATAFIQEGMPGQEEPPPTKSPRHDPKPAATTKRLFTWRNAILGGGAAFALLGFTVVAYWVMWSTGIGPVGNLAAQGVFDEGEAVLLADFANRSNDPSLGGVVTEALRVDLASSRAITLVGTSRVDEILGLMQRRDEPGLDAEVAREVAIRGGIKAVIDGEVGSAGSGYILTATIRAAESGDPLATFRRTAKSPDQVIDAIDGLSQDIREKAGESLRSIKGEARLEQVTTASLDALRLYSEAEELAEDGNASRAKALLEQAVEMDPTFAMAWRKLSVVIQTAGGEPGEEEHAATRAYELRDRLTELERGNAIAYYHRAVTRDLEAQIEAYERLLTRYPDDAPSLNNLAIAYSDRTRHEDALGLLERAIEGPGESSPAHTNYVATLASVGRLQEARAALDRMVERYPNRDQWTLWSRWNLAMTAGELEAAHDLALRLTELPDAPVGWRASGHQMAYTTDAAAGQVDEGRGHVDATLDRLRTLEEHGAYLLMVERAAGASLYLDEGATAARLVAGALTSGAFDAVPPEARPWQGYIVTLSRLGDEERSRELLGRWQDETAGAAGSALTETRLFVDALFLDDPADAAEALETLRSQTECPRCFAWELAELQEEAGDLETAAAEYQLAMNVRSSPYHEFHLIRVLGHERLGKIHEALGDSSRAAEHYAAFAEAWADADPTLQPRVRHARERAATLGAGATGSGGTP